MDVSRTRIQLLILESFVALSCLTTQTIAQDALTSAASFDSLDDPPSLPGHRSGERTTIDKAPAETPTEVNFFERDQLTGSWWSVREHLKSRGIDIAASHTLDWGINTSGGFSRRTSTHQLLDINTTFDLERLIGVDGATFFADAYFSKAYGGSSDIGDLHGVSNIDTVDDLSQLAELWYEQWLFDEKLRLKFGKIDGNSEFAFLEHAAVTLNGSVSIPKTASELPTFPEPATGAVCFYYPTERWYIGAGLFDGLGASGMRTGNRGPDQFFSDSIDSSWFIIAETGLSWSTQEHESPCGRFAIGAHVHTLERPTIDLTDDKRSSGFYALLEQRIYSPVGPASEDARGLYVTWMTGFADREVQSIEFQNMVGLVYEGPFQSRPSDRAAIFVSYLESNRDAGFTRDEYLFETLYSFALTPWLSVTPDIQYIANPSGDREIDDAIRAGLRIELTF